MICGISADAIVILVAWMVSTLLLIHDLDVADEERKRVERLYRRQLRRMEGRQ